MYIFRGMALSFIRAMQDLLRQGVGALGGNASGCAHASRVGGGGGGGESACECNWKWRRVLNIAKSKKNDQTPAGKPLQKANIRRGQTTRINQT